MWFAIYAALQADIARSVLKAAFSGPLAQVRTELAALEQHAGVISDVSMCTNVYRLVLYFRMLSFFTPLS